MKTENILLLLGALFLFRSKKGSSAVGFASESELKHFSKKKDFREFAKLYLSQEKRMIKYREQANDWRGADDKKANEGQKMADYLDNWLQRNVESQANYWRVSVPDVLTAIEYYQYPW